MLLWTIDARPIFPNCKYCLFRTELSTSQRLLHSCLVINVFTRRETQRNRVVLQVIFKLLTFNVGHREVSFVNEI